MRLAAIVAVVLGGAGVGGVACGSKAPPTTSTPTTIEIKGPTDRVISLLPDGAQVVVELDLARLRTNAVIGPLVTSALAGTVRGTVPDALTESLAAGSIGPLAEAEAVVLAAYGVGTSHAASLTILVTRKAPPNGVRLADDLWALGPAEWMAQLEARAAIAGIDAVTAKDGAPAAPRIAAEASLVALRDHAMPPGAPGASFRLVARLPFDARVELAREMGVETVPAQISIWADIVDDFAIVIDADATDGGDRKPAEAVKRLDRAVRRLLVGLGKEPAVTVLGVGPSIERARIVAQGTWLRTIIAVGPDRLGRAVDRAQKFLAAPAEPEPLPEPAAPAPKATP